MCPKSLLRSPGVVPLEHSCTVTEELLAIPPRFFPLLEGKEEEEEALSEVHLDLEVEYDLLCPL
jgi:hypothetical protein